MNPLARRRVAAHALDCVSYLGIAAATVPAGLIATRAGLGKSRRFVVWASAIRLFNLEVGVSATRQSAG